MQYRYIVQFENGRYYHQKGYHIFDYDEVECECESTVLDEGELKRLVETVWMPLITTRIHISLKNVGLHVGTIRLDDYVEETGIYYQYD